MVTSKQGTELKQLCHNHSGRWSHVDALLPPGIQAYGTLVPAVLGVVIASGFEPSFHIIGLVFLLSSTAARAYKSLLQVRLLSGS